MLELVRKELRRGSRNALIVSLVLFLISTWIALLWAVMGLVGKAYPDREVVWIVATAGLVALVTLPFVIRSLRSFFRPTTHSAVRGFGRFDDLMTFLAAIDPEEAS